MNNVEIQGGEFQNSQLKMAGAAILGIALSFGVGAQQSSTDQVFALFDFWNHFRDIGGMILLRILTVASFFLLYTNRLQFVFAGLLVAASWLSFYSISGAFVLPGSFAAIFAYFAFRPQVSTAKRTAGAIAMLALPFLLASILKMNLAYFNGQEFSPTGEFFGFLYYWGLPHDWISPEYRWVFPLLSVATELALFVGLIVRPVLFVHLTLLFTAVLAFIHPLVIFVYPKFFPYAILIDEEWAKDLVGSRARPILENPFSWTIFVIVLFSSTPEFRLSAFRAWPVAIFLTVYHVRILLKKFHAPRQRIDWKSYFCSPGMLAPPLFVVSSFFAFCLGAPSPIGYSMFSANRFRSGTHRIEILSKPICNAVQGSLHFTPVIDADFQMLGFETGCAVRFPTRSGLEGIERALCKIAPDASWLLQLRNSSEETLHRCNQ